VVARDSAAFQSRLGIVRLWLMFRRAKWSSLVGASSLRKNPRLLVNLLRRLFIGSMAFVVKAILRISGAHMPGTPAKACTGPSTNCSARNKIFAPSTPGFSSESQ
jgi:hypothetical protein